MDWIHFEAVRKSTTDITILYILSTNQLKINSTAFSINLKKSSFCTYYSSKNGRLWYMCTLTVKIDPPLPPSIDLHRDDMIPHTLSAHKQKRKYVV